MIDITQQILYWRSQAEEDWEVACQLVSSNKFRHGLFFAHLALEKLLKAHVCRRRQELAPRIHNLVRLAELAEIALNDDKLDILAEMNEFNVEGRYPLGFIVGPTKSESQEYLTKAGEVYQWLTQQL